MFELLVPPEPAQLEAAGGDRARYDREVRPGLMLAAVKELRESGVEPDLWKIEGLEDREDCARIGAAVRSGGRDAVSCVVLGRGADAPAVERWLRAGAGVPGYVGFAVGRTIWWDAVGRYVAGAADRERPPRPSPEPIGASSTSTRPPPAENRRSDTVSEIESEIASQPAAWREAERRAVRARESLPPGGARVVVLGCGTSLYVAQAYASLREAAGAGVTDAFPASEVPLGRDVDGAVAVSRSGTTTEVARALRGLPAGVPTVAITAVAGTPVPEAASASILLEFADERSVVQTRFATATLALLRASLGEDLTSAIADAELALGRPLVPDLDRFEHFVFLGRGWAVGLANEAALKMREAAGAWTESYPAMEFRHGPISVAGPSSLVWALGDVPADLLENARSTGATVVEPELDPMAELIVIQRTAVALAALRGLDPDRPRHLTRSVVLPG